MRPPTLKIRHGREGMVPGQTPLAMQVPKLATQAQAQSRMGNLGSRWQQLINSVPRPAAVIQAAAWIR